MHTYGNETWSTRTVATCALMIVPLVAWPARPPALQAQVPEASTFTTTSVKRSEGIISRDSVHPSVADGRFVWRTAPVIMLIQYAHGVSSPTIEGQVPLEPFYHIEATYPAAAGERDIREMLENLLIERFALRVRHETRTMPIFRLVQMPGGHELGPATVANGGSVMPGRIEIFHSTQAGGWHFVGARVTVRQIADALANRLDRPVVDATGITGLFDVAVIREMDARAFLEAVPDELGLRLEQATDDIEVLVIEQLEMP